MAHPQHISGSVRVSTRLAVLATMVATSAAGAFLVLPGGPAAAADSVPLGTAGTFAVLAGAGVTNTGATTLDGDLGTYPTPAVTGSATLTVTGTNHGAGGVTQGAKTDLDTAYGIAAGAAATAPIAGDLGGLTLPAGVYNSASSIGLTGVLTLDGENDPGAVFIFQAGSALTTASGSQVRLIRGADPCHVFWQVGSSAELGTGSQLAGSILALTDITLTTAVVVDGRVLARNGAVTLDTNTVTVPTCASGGTGSSPTPTPSAGGSTASATPSADGGASPSATPSASSSPAAPAPVASPAPRPVAPPVVATGGGADRGTAATSQGERRRAPARRQVRSVPSGPVSAGGGSASGRGSTGPVAAALLAAVSLAVIGCVRPLPRRHR